MQTTSSSNKIARYLLAMSALALHLVIASCASSPGAKFPAPNYSTFQFDKMIQSKTDWINGHLKMIFGNIAKTKPPEVQEAHEILFHNGYYKRPKISPVEVHRVSEMSELESLEPFRNSETADKVEAALKKAMFCSVCITPKRTYYLFYNKNYELIEVVH